MGKQNHEIHDHTQDMLMSDLLNHAKDSIPLDNTYDRNRTEIPRVGKENILRPDYIGVAFLNPGTYVAFPIMA